MTTLLFNNVAISDCEIWRVNGPYEMEMKYVLRFRLKVGAQFCKSFITVARLMTLTFLARGLGGFYLGLRLFGCRYIRQNDTLQNDTRQNDTRQNDTQQKDTQQNDTQQNDTQQNDTWQNDTQQKDTQQNDTLQNDTWQNDTR
jgi:hypothetical protein